MKIKKDDIEQQKDLNDLFYDLIEKYYPDHEDENFVTLDLVTKLLY